MVLSPRRQIRFVAPALCLALLVMFTAGRGTARAEAQVSDRFQQAAKVLARYVVVEKVKAVCAGVGDGALQGLCNVFIDGLTEFITSAIDGQLDKAYALDRFRQFARRAVVATLTDLSALWVRAEFLASLKAQVPAPVWNQLQVERLVTGALGCLTESLLNPGEGDCKPLLELLKPGELSVCGTFKKGLDRGACVLEKSLGLLHKALKKQGVGENPQVQLADALDPELLLMGTLFQDIARAMRQGGGLSRQIRLALDRIHERDTRFFSSMYSHRAFNGPLLLRARKQLEQAAPGTCPERDRLVQELDTFYKSRHQRYREFARAVAGGTLTPYHENLLLVTPSIMECASLPMWYQQWRKAVEVYLFAGRFASRVHQVEIPALIGAALVDYLRKQDRSELERNLREVASRTLTRALVAEAEGIWTCDSPENQGKTWTSSCQHHLPAAKTSSSFQLAIARTAPAAPPAASTAASPGARPAAALPSAGEGAEAAPTERQVNGLLVMMVEQRYTAEAMERTCLVQLVNAVLLGQPVPLLPGFGAVCRLDGIPEDLNTLLQRLTATLGVGLEPVAGVSITSDNGDANPPRLRQWPSAQLEPDIAGAARLAAASRLTPAAAMNLIARLGEQQLEKQFQDVETIQQHVGEGLRLITSITQAYREGDADEVRRMVLSTAADLLREPVTRFVQRMFVTRQGAAGTGVSCTDRPTDLTCLVKALALALFDPVLSYATGQTDQEAFVSDLLRRVEALDALGSSPFLVAVGPAYSYLMASGEEDSHHLTFLDQWGLALRWGDRKQFFAGGFVGGFVDSLIRTVGGADLKDVRFLMGATGGIRQFARDFPIGLEVHLAWAPPLDLSGNLAVMGIGLAVLMPVEMLLSK